MSRADNSHHLRRAAAARHLNAVGQARAAIDALDRNGTPLTFSAVARTAGVSRSWLYTQSDLRETILRLRRVQPRGERVPVRPAERATPESLRRRLDASKDEITRLRVENAALREQVARSLGVHRAGLVDDMSPTRSR